MRIKQLQLNNFKIFKDCKVDFRPLTLLTGTNSSGKTTILNAITAVLQTQPPHQFPFEFVPNGKNCTLGTFRDIAHGRNARNNFRVGLTFDDKGREHLLSGAYRFAPSGNQILLDHLVINLSGNQLDLAWKGHEKGYSMSMRSEAYNKLARDEQFVGFRSALVSYVKSTVEKAQKPGSKPVALSLESLLSEQKRESVKLEGRNSADIINEIKKQPAGGYVLAALQLFLTRLGTDFSYVGPVRVYPSRFYQTEDTGQNLDPAGRNSVPILYEWKKYSPKKYKEVLKLIRLLELASTLETRSSLDEILKLNVQPFHHKEKVNLTDVGFGVSQALPILIADVALPKDGTLIVNQPEVHLHPSSQALLGNYLVSRLKVRNYILETHSEYLINRLRLLAVKGEVNVKDISIIFVEAAPGMKSGPRIHHIEVGSDGSLTNAPKSFFETYYLDTFDLAMGGFTKSHE